MFPSFLLPKGAVQCLQEKPFNLTLAEIISYTAHATPINGHKAITHSYVSSQIITNVECIDKNLGERNFNKSTDLNHWQKTLTNTATNFYLIHTLHNYLVNFCKLKFLISRYAFPNVLKFHHIPFNDPRLP